MGVWAWCDADLFPGYLVSRASPFSLVTAFDDSTPPLSRYMPVFAFHTFYMIDSSEPGII